ncbi:hypothetical protein BX600DRAFT_475750 [Xylariales sp. PMI_506]|nr:hypothetical protein BX600DRAFT_475750 [Xylariales sp. PMI_506]
MAEVTEAHYGFEKSIYFPSFLSLIYDWLVLGFNCSYIWCCPVNEVQLPFFSEHFSSNHLDIGVATGYFPATALSRPFRSHEAQKLALLDFNAASLQAAEKRVLARTTDTAILCIEADATAEMPKQLQKTHNTKFDSISMFNLIHCIPAGSNKLRAFSVFKDVLDDDGVLVGCTILGAKSATGWISKWYLAFYNRVGVLHNWYDEREDIEAALKKEFGEVETWVVGMVLLFRARKTQHS